MKNYRGFKVETMQATNTQPARVKITDLRFAKMIVLHYSAHSADNSKDLVINHLQSLGIEVTGQTWHENRNGIHQYSIYLTENFTNQI